MSTEFRGESASWPSRESLEVPPVVPQWGVGIIDQSLIVMPAWRALSSRPAALTKRRCLLELRSRRRARVQGVEHPCTLPKVCCAAWASMVLNGALRRVLTRSALTCVRCVAAIEKKPLEAPGCKGFRSFRGVSGHVIWAGRCHSDRFVPGGARSIQHALLAKQGSADPARRQSAHRASAQSDGSSRARSRTRVDREVS